MRPPIARQPILKRAFPASGFCHWPVCPPDAVSVLPMSSEAQPPIAPAVSSAPVHPPAKEGTPSSSGSSGGRSSHHHSSRGRGRGRGSGRSHEDHRHAERTKRPDVQHYKPGAFKSTPKGEEEDGRFHAENGAPAPTPAPAQTQPPSSGKRSGKGRGQHSVDKGTAKPDPVSTHPEAGTHPPVEPGSSSTSQAAHSGGNSGGGGGGAHGRGGKSKKKKPDQAHYVPKKVDAPGSDQPEQDGPTSKVIPTSNDDPVAPSSHKPSTSDTQPKEEAPPKASRNKSGKAKDNRESKNRDGNRRARGRNANHQNPPLSQEIDHTQQNGFTENPSAKGSQQGGQREKSATSQPSSRASGIQETVLPTPEPNRDSKANSEEDRSMHKRKKQTEQEQQPAQPATQLQRENRDHRDRGSNHHNQQQRKDFRRDHNQQSQNSRKFEAQIPPRLRDRQQQQKHNHHHHQQQQQQHAHRDFNHGHPEADRERSGGGVNSQGKNEYHQHSSQYERQRYTRSPSPRQVTRRSQSPMGVVHHRGGGGGGGGGREGGSLNRRTEKGRRFSESEQHPPSDWGNRYFREPSGYQHSDNYRAQGGAWEDHRGGGGRGAGRGGRGGGGRVAHNSQVPPKVEVPPRFMKGRGQVRSMPASQQRFSGQNQSHSPLDADRVASGDEEEDISVISNSHRDTADVPKSGSSRPPLLSMDSEMSDWSVEVDEDEIRMKNSLLDRQSSRSVPPAPSSSSGPSGGGIIRLPPTQAPSSSSNQSKPHQSSNNRGHNQHSTAASNPAWRGVPQREIQYQMEPSSNRQGKSSLSHRGERDQKFLFDHKNPNKPIPAPNHAHGRPPPGNSGGSSSGPMRDGGASSHPFQENFAPPPFSPQMAPHNHQNPPQQQQHHQQQQHNLPPQHHLPHPHSQPHRHPPPLMGVPMPKMQPQPEWYDVKDSDPKTKHYPVVLGMAQNDFALQEIFKQGHYCLCHLWDTEVQKLRKSIQLALEHLIRTDLQYCAFHDVEFHIWKIAFYRLLEFMKLGVKDGPEDLRRKLEANINELLEEGIEYYTHLLDVLDSHYKLHLEQYYDVLEPRSHDKHFKLALMSVQKCLLCLGDLSRYRELIQETSNFGKARQYYQKASNIEPRNGRPFNQLGVLAVNTKRKFEAVYYNMRCLMAKNPFQSSQESLTVMFEDIKRKWEANDRKRLEDKEARRRAAQKEVEGNQLIKGTHLRKEIWIRPEGGRRLHRTTSALDTPETNEDDEDLRELSTSDLNRRFNNTFLYLIGKLYSNISMETFGIALELLRKEFRELLARVPLPLDSKRLVQIMSLNMFVIEQTKMKGGDSENYRSAMQVSALQLAFDMFGILVERSNNLLEGFRPSLNETSQCIFPDDDLPNLLSAIKVWCDWLLGNNDTWYPIVADEPFTHLAALATHLEKLKPVLKPILLTFLEETQFHIHPDRDSFELVRLGEDALLCDFSPWFRGLTWELYRRYAPRSLPLPLAQDVRRIDAINFCVDFLEGLEPPILKWSLPDNAHISLVETTKSPQEKANANLTHMIESEEDILEESYSDEDSTLQRHATLSNTKDGGQLSALKQKKNELERRKLVEEREARRMQREILAEHVNVVLEICPRYIVTDTNCFVDHLNDIKNLANTNQFRIRVPLVVLTELEGLAKGAHPHKYASHGHAVMVSENARRALQFLHDHRQPSIKCVTSKGTTLSTMGVANEEDNTEGKNNDDLILNTCLSLSELAPISAIASRGGEGGSSSSGGADKMRVVKREVVLLTEDRNLKLKSHLHDIPVNKVGDFVRWACQGP
ncbi:telomerase-binding protein EST1A-like isoform X1 [Tigriopus californicus]|uniref:telomerase-binding protein EST1A-like isoform X1 n=1 Tax=Tigriopus californicus TaxID=6832 RepID=UPI0027DAAAA1|nr:telomerase-binding protein EST1A-like isoform X1 [Tigriopus californicus]